MEIAWIEQETGGKAVIDEQILDIQDAIKNLPYCSTPQLHGTMG